jgi:tape measure domain-containing protein
MAKGITSGGGLKYKAQLDITEALRNAQKLKKELAGTGVELARGFDTKPLTGYQQAQIALKKTLIESQGETEKLRQDAARYRAELELGRVAQQANRTELERLRAAEQGLKNDLQAGRITQQAHRTELEKNKVAQQALTATLAQGKIDQQNYRTELARMNLARKQEVEAARQARRAAQEVAGSYNEAQAKLKKLGAEIKSAEGQFKRLTPEIKAKIKEYNELNEALKKFDAQMGNHQRNVGNYKGAIRSTAEDLLGFATAYLSIGNALTYVFNQTLAFQRIRTPLAFILGSEGEADNKLAELKKFANDIGVEYFSIANSYKQFTAAARASNFDLEKSEKIFKSVAKAGAVLGLSNDTLQGTFLALQQMISKGTVQSEELRGQLSERLPGAFSLAAKAMGVTEQELGKLLKAGQVTANDMLPKLAVELDKAYGDKAGESIGGLNAELNRLYSSLQALAGEGSALDRNLFQPIIIGARQVADEIAQMTRGSFGENLRYIFTFSGDGLKNQRAAYDLRDSRRNNENAQSEAEKFNLEGKSLADLKTKYSQLTETMRKAYKDHEIFKKGIADGTLKETKDASLTTYTAIANGLNAQRKRIADGILSLKGQQKTANKELLDSELKSVTAIRKRIADLNKMDGSADEGSEISNRIKALQDRLKKPTAPKSYTAEINAQRTLQEEISALTKKGRAKQKDEDDQDLADIDIKYRKLREKAIAFNKDPKNRARGLKVNTSGLLEAQSSEEDVARDKNASKKLKTTIDDQKKLYQEFEQYKSDFGVAKARERYEKLIDVDQTYLESLRNKQSKILGDDKAKGGDAGGGEYAAEQLKVLQDATKEAEAEERKKSDAVLKEFMSYADRRKRATEQYEADLITIGDNAESKKVRKKKYDAEIKELDDANSDKLESYEKLFDGIEKLSTRNALRAVQTARKLLAKEIKDGVLTPEQIKEINELLNNTELSVRNKSGQILTDLSGAINDLASSVGNMDAAFGKVLGTVGNIVGQLGSVKKGFADFKTAKAGGDTLGQLGAGLGIFSAGIGIFQSVVSLFDRSQQREEQASYARDLQNKQTEALNKALERQVALLNDVYGTDRVRDYSAAIKQAQDNQAKYASEVATKFALTGNKLVDDLIEKYNSGNLRSFDKDIFEGILKNGSLSKIGNADIATLQRLLDEGKLDANTSTIVTNLIKAKETAEQLVNNLRAENVGTTLESIADEFISTLTDGTQDFGKTFESTIQKSILNGFKGEIIRKQLQALYSQFAELSEGGLTSKEIETLRKSYLSASEKAKKDLEDLSKATGIDLTSNGNDGGSVGVIQKNVTEATASEWIGLIRAQYDNQKRQLDVLTPVGKTIGELYLVAKSNFDVQVKIEANTFRTANNTDQLNTKLDAIIKNTGQNVSTGYDKGN